MINIIVMISNNAKQAQVRPQLRVESGKRRTHRPAIVPLGPLRLRGAAADPRFNLLSVEIKLRQHYSGWYWYETMRHLPSSSLEQMAYSWDASDPPIIYHCRTMLPSSWQAVRDGNAQARIADDLVVFWTVLNVELVVCSRTLVGACRGAHGLTLAT